MYEESVEESVEICRSSLVADQTEIDAVLPSDVPRNRNEWSDVVEDDDEDIFDVTDWEWSNEAE